MMSRRAGKMMMRRMATTSLCRVFRRAGGRRSSVFLRGGGGTRFRGEQLRELLAQVRGYAIARVLESLAEVVALAAAVADVTDGAFTPEFSLRVRVAVVAIHEGRL